MAGRQKPTVTELGLDIAALNWHRSGVGDGSLEVAFVAETDALDPSGPQWILLRVAGDQSGRVLVYDRVEWMCFIDGAKSGEFDPGYGSNLCTEMKL